MANINSTAVSNLIADPQVMSSARNVGGVMRVNCGSVAAAAGDLSAGDTIMLANIPANAAIVSIKIFNDDLDTGTTHTMHIGLYLVAEDGTVSIKDVDAYASATTDMRGVVTVGTEVAFEARNINLMGQRVFEDAGDASDLSANGFYTVGFESQAAGDAAGDISWIITYVI
jgi:hypothetical protein|tara:strand:+ start:36 stop:548 length:513 start_codon:yes stop_codon:yes gene_type:complete